MHQFYEKQFEPYLAAGVKGERTRELHKDAMKSLLSEMGTLYMNNITLAVIENFIQKRSKKVGSSSINGSLRTLRRALRLAVEW